MGKPSRRIKLRNITTQSVEIVTSCHALTVGRISGNVFFTHNKVLQPYLQTLILLKIMYAIFQNYVRQALIFLWILVCCSQTGIINFSLAQNKNSSSVQILNTSSIISQHLAYFLAHLSTSVVRASVRASVRQQFL